MGEGNAATRPSPARRLVLPRARSPLWVAAGGAYVGVTIYVLVVVTARVLGPSEYGAFSLFWSAYVLVSIGVFLPIEQVLARRQAAGPSLGGVLGAGVRVGLFGAGICAVAVAAFEVVTRSGGGMALGALAGFAVGVTGCALQSPARGMLAGRLDLRGYAIVIGVDGTVRTIGVIALWAAGARQASPYMICVGASALVAGIVGVWLVRRGGDAARAERAAPRSAERCASREASGLGVALLCMQALLNSPVLVAGAFGGRRSVHRAAHGDRLGGPTAGLRHAGRPGHLRRAASRRRTIVRTTRRSSGWCCWSLGRWGRWPGSPSSVPPRSARRWCAWCSVPITWWAA